ncbi:hypothetical protein BAUCODRAFT_22532 [Baudoinia panamericana UAMH 10762]|uniref:Nucleolar 27S pre-rRNA processing Urb2/Npa2 C-terminal domain-containing protein n=1 Tax=Baudoinia panamericana (strain UAMH 10762) TaxID=717646 RepID=M2MR08_BAUPA|nr:uncharacterized protein BAUCODRAFT_22532 [Baudoinia panamericana UAMH 10762]EMC99276.1 hypothetical protein BAUCODRAFT_22532 [Baudoinia panamericana UAMH 10762]
MAPSEGTMKGQSSLHRLKALDQLPNVQSRLDEARSLCTHTARADMILRWTVEKVKSDEDYRSCVSTWNLFAATCRLLPLERLAAILASADFLRLASTAINAETTSFEVVSAIADCMNLLHALSQDPSGAPLRALLTADGANAVTFTGHWYAACARVLQSCDRADLESRCGALLNSAFSVWNLRRRSPAEDELFAKQCLVPCTAVLAALPASTARPKRKRGTNSTFPMGDTRQTLESMLARHVFLPARDVFFDAQSAHDHNPRDGNSGNSVLDLPQRLQAFSGAITSKQLSPGTAPALLGIALRCIPMTTQKQRVRERPWVEAIFAALLDCVVLNGEPVGDNTLVDMLVVVGNKASLSVDTLSHLITRYGSCGANSDRMAQLDFFAQIVRLDPNVFVRPQMASWLFEVVEAAGKHLVSSAEEQVADSRALRDQLRDSILTPVMEAFARNRKLPAFIERWHQTLLELPLSQKCSIWLELRQPLSFLIEANMTGDSVTELVSHYRGALARNADYSYTGHTASMIVLQGLLGGVRDAELLDELHSHLHTLYGALMSLADQAKNLRGYWTFVITVFERWWPSYLALNRDPASLASLADQVVGSNAVRVGTSYLDSLDLQKDEDSSILDVETAEAVQFLCCVAHHLSDLDMEESRLPFMKRVMKHVQRGDLEGIIRYPKCLDLFEIKAAFLFEPAARAVLDGQDVEVATESLRALTASIVDNGLTEMFVDLVLTGTASGEGDSADPQPMVLASAATVVKFRVLADVAPSIFSASHRQRVLDWLAYPKLDVWGSSHAPQQRLALMVRLLKLPCPNARMLIDAKALWQLKDKSRDTGPSSESCRKADVNESTASMLEQVANAIFLRVRHDLSRDMARSVMRAHWQNANAFVTTLQLEPSFDGMLDGVATVKALLSSADNANSDDGTDADLKANTLNSWISTLSDHVERAGKPPMQSATILASLDALAHLPNSSLTSTLFEESAETARLVRIIKGVLDSAQQSLHDQRDETVQQTIAVRCFELICRFRLHPGINEHQPSSLALQLLETGLTAREHAATLTAFSNFSVTANAQDRSDLLQKVLPANATPSPQQMLLAKVLLSTLGKDDLNNKEAASPQRILERILRVTRETTELLTIRRACACVSMILKEKLFMVNQYTIEMTLDLWQAFEQSHDHDALRLLYLDFCRIFTVLLQQHRSRLRDRMHMVIVLLQALLTRLFRIKAKGSIIAGLSPRHAGVLARIVQSLCNPPLLRGNAKGSDLVDQARKAQAHVGQYVPLLLHHYCVQILAGTLAEGVREALLPGLWAVIKAVEVSDTDGMRSLSAAMNNSERAVLRSLYEDYKLFGK